MLLGATALAAPASSAAPATGATHSSPPGEPGPGTPSPPAHYVQTTRCVAASNIPASVRNGVSWAQAQLDYPSLWSLANRGEGQTVAVIDTGINPVSAFGDRLHAGIDLVLSGGDGLQDCDGHGTVVAGIIAAAPDPSTGFAGVAPGVDLLSIRQSSLDYGIKNAEQSADENVAGTTGSLADAIDYAVRAGAEIVNISEDSCSPGNTAPDDGARAVASAVRRAVAADVVIVAAAGNVDSSSDCKTQNTPGLSPATVPVPAGLPGVLSVAAVDRTGRPAAFSLAGPWVDVAAPGTDIVSTNPLPGTSGQINRFLTGSGVSPIQGTSFAAPYVTGLVALVRARFPGLDAQQVIARVERTAVHPAADGGRNDYVGYGMVDPTAALTDVLPGESASAPAQRYGPQTLPAARPHRDPERSARSTALLGTLGLFVLIVVGLVATATRRRRAAGLSARRGAG